MGAWAAGSFDNWVSGLAKESGDSILREALAPIASGGARYLEAPECSTAVAAAEAVAGALGRPSPSLPDEVAGWIDKNPQVNLDVVALAGAAIDRIVNSSELKQLWDESGSADEWRAAMSDLRSRLG